MEPWLFLGLAMALGVKHAFDGDHLVAVSSLLSRAESRRRTVTMSLSWAAGHMLTAGALTVALFLFRDRLPLGLFAQLDVAVAAMLILVGILALVWELRLIHTHAHAHGGVVHAHTHLHLLGQHRHSAMAGIGIVHGIASNDELLLLLAASLGVSSLGGLLAGVGVFSAGVVVGMVLFGLALTAPLLRARREGVRRAVSVAAALLSLGYGMAMLAGFPGWNPLPLLAL